MLTYTSGWFSLDFNTMFYCKLVKKFPLSYEKRRFITSSQALANGPWIRRIHFTFVHYTSWRPFLILPFRLRLLFFLLSNKTLCLYLFTHACYTPHSSYIPSFYHLMRGVLHTLSSEYYPQSSLLNHVEIILYLEDKRTRFTPTQCKWKFC